MFMLDATLWYIETGNVTIPEKYKEGNVLFNDTLNTFYLRLYGVRHMEMGRYVLFNDALNTFYLRLYGVRHTVKDHSDSERKPAAAT